MSTPEIESLPLTADEPRPSRRLRLDVPRRRWPWKWPLRFIFAIAVIGVLAAALHWSAGSFRAGPAVPLLTHTVQPGDLRITVTESGSLESAENVDIKCEVAGGSKILWIVEDGKEVEKNAELVKLDSSKLEEDLSQQKIAYQKAVAARIQAEKDYAAAEIAVREYLEGTFRKDLKEQKSKVTVALEGLRSAENGLQHAQRMYRKGYISPLQLETQQFAVEKAKLDLDSAQTARDVLERFTRPKMVQELESKRDAAEAKMKSEKTSLELEEMKLKRMEKQVANCILRAPKAGMVVYANDPFWFNDENRVKLGAQVRDQQTLLRLPDLTQMQVKVGVHEAKVDQIRKGMTAEVRIRDRTFSGTVISVANQPEAPRWMSPFTKKYETKVAVKGSGKDLRPGLTAEAEILVSRLKNVLSVPVAAVTEQDGKFLCFVKQGDRTERRTLVLGQGNDKFVEVKQGLAAGEQVVLRPQALLEPGEQQRQKNAETEKKGVTKAEGQRSKK
jgi:HlyD family secretion protein